MGIDFKKLNVFFGNQPKMQVSTEETETKKDLKDVPVGQPQVKPEEKLVGMDLFVREADVIQASGAEALAVYNQSNISRTDKAPQVNTSPAATERRLETALGNIAPFIAAETGVAPDATVNGLAPEIASLVNINPLLAQYLNTADSARIEQSMQQFLQIA